jgi:hypothetical protein
MAHRGGVFDGKSRGRTGYRNPEASRRSLSRPRMQGNRLQASPLGCLLRRMSPFVAHSDAALVGGMSAAGESRQPTVEPVSRF